MLNVRPGSAAAADWSKPAGSDTIGARVLFSVKNDNSGSVFCCKSMLGIYDYCIGQIWL